MSTLRVLDPQSAEQLPGGRAPRPTMYLNDRILVCGLPGLGRDEPLALLEKVAGAHGLGTQDVAQVLRLNDQ